MLKGKHPLGNLELFEELDDRLSEKISGGSSLELSITVVKLEELMEFELFQPNLLTRIQEKIAERFSQIGPELALACSSNQYGIYNCEVSTNGETKSFVVDTNKQV